jgi:hypothetical protein
MLQEILFLPNRYLQAVLWADMDPDLSVRGTDPEPDPAPDPDPSIIKQK